MTTTPQGAKAARVDLNFYQGARNKFTLTFKFEDGEPYIDLGDATEVIFTAKRSEDDVTPLFEIVVEDDDAGQDWDNGVAQIVVEAADAALVKTDCAYDIVAIFSDGPKALAWGDLVVPRKKIFELA